jgi:PII-like signaling protein
LPIVVEIVDEPDKVQKFLPELDGLVTEGMITLEKVNIIAYRHDPGSS